MNDERFPPGFGPSLAGAAAGFLGGAFLTAMIAWPFALASWSTLAVGGANDFAQRFLLVVVLLIALQLLISAWIAQQAASLVGEGAVRYRRALGAVIVGGLATVVAAGVLPAGATLPVFGHAWVGILVAAWVMSTGPRVAVAR